MNNNCSNPYQRSFIAYCIDWWAFMDNRDSYALHWIPGRKHHLLNFLPATAGKKKAINISLSGPLSSTGHLGGRAPYSTGRTVNKQRKGIRKGKYREDGKFKTHGTSKNKSFGHHLLTWYEDFVIPACFLDFPILSEDSNQLNKL